MLFRLSLQPVSGKKIYATNGWLIQSLYTHKNLSKNDDLTAANLEEHVLNCAPGLYPPGKQCPADENFTRLNFVNTSSDG